MTEEKEKLRFVSTAKGTLFVGAICDECIENDAQYAIFRKNSLICPFNKMEKCINQTPYYFFIEKNEQSIIVFSQFRIPFDMPKSGGEIRKNFKNDLIKAIKKLKPFENCVLSARYGTTKKAFYDIENVLFYNISTSNFKPFTNQGVVFSAVSEEEISELRKKYNIPDEYTHYYEYQLIENQKPKELNSVLAELKNIPLKCLGVTPAKTWETIRSNESNIQVYNSIDCDCGDTFSIVLEITKPKTVSFNIMTAMKPLLDGLICAFHSSQFTENELDYFSQKLNCNKALLDENPVDVLGERESQYLQMYRNNVKWNPADDLCDYVTIFVQEGNDWSVSGKIYSTVKCPKCGKGKLSKLLWGMPAYTEELQKDIESGKTRLAGCCITKENPARYYCRWCKKEF